jgi:hypothetical protein
MNADRKLSTGHWIIVGIVFVVGLMALYVLSLGPVMWLTAHGYLSQPWIYAKQDFYRPLNFVDNYSPEPVRNALRWYAELGQYGGPFYCPSLVRPWVLGRASR